MGLSLVVGPAHVGKVALLLERYLDVLERDPWLVVPNRVDVDRVERDLIRRRPALLAGTIGTFDDLFRAVAEGADDALPSQPRPSARSPSGARSAVASSTVCACLPRRRGSRTRCCRRSASSSLGSSSSDGLERRARRARRRVSRGAGRRMGVRDRDGMRRDAVERLRGDLDAWSGAPLFAYGFEDLTGAEWALVEALAARTDVTLSIPYEPGRAAFAALVEDGRGPRGARWPAHRGAAARTQPDAAARSPPPRARAVLRRTHDGPAARRIHSIPRGGRHARHRRAPRERGCGAPPWWHCAGARRRRLRVRRPVAGATRRGVRAAGSAVRRRAPAAAGRIASRRRAPLGACGTSGSAAAAATCSRSSARRSPGSSVARSTSSRGACAGAPSPSTGGSKRRASGCAVLRCLPSSSCGGSTIPSRARVRSSRSWCATHGASSRRRRATTHGSTRARTEPRSGRSASSLRSPGASPQSCVTTCSQRSNARALRPRARRRVGSPSSTTNEPGPARSRSCSCSASRKGRSRAAGVRRRSSTTSCGPRSGDVSRDRTPSRATATSSTRPARARRGGSCSFARRRATRVCRASRARSGRTSGHCSTPPTFSASRGAGRSRL